VFNRRAFELAPQRERGWREGALFYSNEYKSRDKKWRRSDVKQRRMGGAITVVIDIHPWTSFARFEE
jgi:hypothetical protein